MDWESEGISVWLHVWLCAQHWRKHCLDLSSTLLQDSVTAFHGGREHYCPSWLSMSLAVPALWTLGSPTTSGLPRLIKWWSYAPVWTTGPESPEKASRNRPLLEVFIWLSRRWSQRSLLTWKSSASMKSVNPCGRETLQNSGERRQHYRKLSSGEVGLGADAWPRPAAPHGSVFVKIVTLSPRPPGLIYGTVGKQLPEQHVPPLDY